MCVLPSLTPIGEDVPDDAVVSLADNELEGALLSRVAAALAPASRARGKLDATSRDEGAEPQDLFVSQSAIRLPAAGRAHARDEISDRNERIITEDIRPHRLGELEGILGRIVTRDVIQ